MRKGGLEAETIVNHVHLCEECNQSRWETSCKTGQSHTGLCYNQADDTVDIAACLEERD